MRLNWIVCGILLVNIPAILMADGPKEDLERTMKAMNKPYKVLIKQIKDKSKNADSLKQLADLEAATLRAKGETPDHMENVSKEKRDKALADYRAMMATCLSEQLEVEQALLDDDNETAAKKLDELTETMKSGHKEFRHEEHGHD
ncbi:hypothetical protein BH10PLA1_BH10PLA1_05670 [soil metagenome]